MQNARLRSTILIALLLAGCAATRATTAPPATRIVPTLLPTLAARGPATPPPAHTPAPDTGWVSGRSGVELRSMRATSADRRDIPLTIVRLDPAQVRLRVAYAPDRPRALRTWFEQQR